MSLHSYSRCWLHLIWTTLDREPMLTKPAAVETSRFLTDYSLKKGIYMKINYVNPEHVHTLVDLPTNKSIEEVMKLLKGASSHWINQQRLLRGKFYWGRGYGELSPFLTHMLSELPLTSRGQEKHHHKKTFRQEFELFVKKYGLKWYDD